MEKLKQRKNNGVTVNNRDQIQSYILTTAKYDFNVYEKRLLYRLVEIAQSEVQGLDFSKDCKKTQHTLFGTIEVTLPVASLLNGEDDKNYSKAKKALDSLSEKKFYYEDERVWEKLYIIIRPKVQKYKNTMTFELEPRIWDVILDFSKGYRKYELVTAMNFKSVYSMRFYELLSEQIKPLEFSIEKLKEMFCVADKYKLTGDFIRYVVEPAKKELDELAPYSFEWKPEKTGKKIIGITFFPVFKPEHRDAAIYANELEKRTSLAWDLNRQVIDYLKNSLDFTIKEIKNNRELFIMAQLELSDVMGDLAILKAKSRDKKNPKGWFINALKGKIADAKTK